MHYCTGKNMGKIFFNETKSSYVCAVNHDSNYYHKNII